MHVTSGVVCDSVLNLQRTRVGSKMMVCETRGSHRGVVKIQVFWGEMLCCWVSGY